LNRLCVADRGRGSPVLLVHGQPGLGSDWDAVAALLVDDHRVLVPDRPGYGASGSETLSMQGNAEALADVLAERHAAPATVVGHSYGGGVAILLAAAHPELVAGLVLVGSVGRADSVGAVDHLLALPVVGEVLSAAGLFALGRVLPRLRGVVGTTRPSLERLRAILPDDRFVHASSQLGRQLWRSFVAEQRWLLDEIGDVEAALGALDVPTVVISGTWDVVVPPSVSASIAATVPVAQLVIVPRTGHFVPRDAPAAVASAVRRVEGRARGEDPNASEDAGAH